MKFTSWQKSASQFGLGIPKTAGKDQGHLVGADAPQTFSPCFSTGDEGAWLLTINIFILSPNIHSGNLPGNGYKEANGTGKNPRHPELYMKDDGRESQYTYKQSV